MIDIDRDAEDVPEVGSILTALPMILLEVGSILTT